MRILYIIPSLVQAGPINVVSDLTKVMQFHNHICEIAYFDDITDRPLNHFTCKCFKVNDIQWDNYDIIHTHGFRPDLLARIKAPRNLRNRMISTMHNLVFEENYMLHGCIKGWIISKLELWAASKHNNIITLTNVAKQYYKQYFKSEKLTVCCNTCFLTDSLPDKEDIKKINRFKSVSGLKYIIGTHCYITQRKGLEQVIKALPLLHNIGFVIIGSGPEKSKLEKLAEMYGVTKQVLFLGQRKDASRLLPAFDIYVIPSRSEGFPLALLEASARGIASISSDIPIFKEIFPEENVLPKFKLDDIDSLISTIIKVLKYKDELGERIKQKFSQSYAPEIFYLQHISLYNKIANK